MIKRIFCIISLLSCSILYAADNKFASVGSTTPPKHTGGQQAFRNVNQGPTDTTTTAATTDIQTPEKAVPEGNEPNKQPTIRDEAFKQLLNKTLPLRPEQIIELHKELDKSQQAVQTPVNTPPQPVSSTLTVDLSPGTTPPLVRLATGFVTSIVFVDATGQPWPVVDYSLGNPKNFNIQWDKKRNTLFIQNTAAYVTANLAVRLENLDTPIMISLVTGQREVDYRIDLQIRAHGPNAQAPIVTDNLPNSTSPFLLSVLDGVPPNDSIELKVSGEYGRAWLYNNKLIFRTKLTLLSPGWTSLVSSQDGTKVYELMKTPLILASQNGKPIKIELTGL